MKCHNIFYTCPSDGKQRISFTYPPSLSTFSEMIERKISLYTTEKLSHEDNYWKKTGSLVLDVLEKRIRLCNDENEKECLPKIRKRIDSEKQAKCLQLIFDVVTTDYNDQTIRNQNNKLIFPGIEEIRKEVPRWSYKLTDDLEEQEEENEEESMEDHEIRSRKAKRVVIYTDKEETTNAISNTSDSDQAEEVSLIRYSQQSDFRRDLIKGSMRAQRRKTVTWEILNREMHVKCTYNGVQLSETEFPKDWLTDGIQIKILFPFRLKPWRKSKVRSHHRDTMKKRKKDNFWIDQTNQNTIHFISTMQKSLSNISNKNSNIYCDLSSLSQAYVFYTLSQVQVNNKYYLRSVFQYHGTHLFLKDRIKDYCGTRGLFDSKPKHKKVYKYGMNEWKNWLKSHYQYNLSQTQWSRLVPQKWRNRVNQRSHKYMNYEDGGTHIFMHQYLELENQNQQEKTKAKPKRSWIRYTTRYTKTKEKEDVEKITQNPPLKNTDKSKGNCYILNSKRRDASRCNVDSKGSISYRIDKRGIFIIEPVRLSIKWDEEFLIYQTIGISLIYKKYLDENPFDKSISRHSTMLVSEDKNYYDLCVPENILSTRRRRELRILICFNSWKGNVVDVDRNLIFFNENDIRNCGQFLKKDKHFNTDPNKTN
uniref:Protein TIC 214 n=1 Tax=Spirodela intermedia TaxID=51605 RepID=A0A8S0X3Z0_SPIIN